MYEAAGVHEPGAVREQQEQGCSARTGEPRANEAGRTETHGTQTRRAEQVQGW